MNMYIYIHDTPNAYLDIHKDFPFVSPSDFQVAGAPMIAVPPPETPSPTPAPSAAGAAAEGAASALATLPPPAEKFTNPKALRVPKIEDTQAVFGDVWKDEQYSHLWVFLVV